MKENALIYSIGAIGYSLLEIIWRGYTHWSMMITGGICFFIVYKTVIKNIFKNVLLKSLIGAIIITSIEFIVGVIVNLKLELNVWDYSNQPFNILGQVCLTYFILWFLLCIPLVFFSMYIRNKILPKVT